MAAPTWARGPDGKPKHWAGGRLKLVAGQERFVIERQVGPTKFSITLDTADPNDALAELALFNRNPAGYRSPARQRAAAAERTASLAGVVWTETLVDEFLRGCKARAQRGDLSERYVRYTLEKYLGDWSDVLGGRDMRTLALLDIRAGLKRWKGVAEDKRIVALKAFTAWLRQEGKLYRSEDPTLDLVVPPVVASRDLRSRAYPIPLVEALYRGVTLQSVRDLVLLRAKAGMHHTEIQRLGKADFRVVDDPCGIFGTVLFWHKRGKPQLSSLDAQCFAAAKRMAKVAPDHKTVWRHLNLALKTDDVQALRPHPPLGVMPERLRHSYATWKATVGVRVWAAGQRGVPLEDVAESMGHTSTRTTAKHYLGEHVPAMDILPVRLVHPDDPASALPVRP